MLIYCTLDQVGDEVRSNVQMVNDVTTEPSGSRTSCVYLCGTLRIREVYRRCLNLGVIQELRSNSVDMVIPFVEEVGEAAFYGPKIDIRLTPLFLRNLCRRYNWILREDRFELSYGMRMARKMVRSS